jgi:hypothetical protein
MPRKRSRKKHSVSAELHVKELTKTGSSPNLEIYANEEKIGMLILGNGVVVWFGRKRIDWTKFADMMDELAYGRTK